MDMKDDVALFQEIESPKKRAFLRAYVLTGRVGLACDAAGVNHGASRSIAWRNDFHFVEALERAEEMRGDLLEDAATTRAVEGVKSYKFSRGGAPIAHPEQCRCGHGIGEHLDCSPEALAGAVAAGLDPPGSGPCTGHECDCRAFVGRPYFEHSYSDTLLAMLLKGARPEKYRERMELRGALANLDMGRLSNEQVARIAKGEHPLAVLAAGADPAGLLDPGEGEG